VAEDPGAPPAGGAPAKKGGLPKKIFGVPTPVLLAGAATAGAVLLIWLRKRKAAAAGTPTATTSVNSVASAEETQIQSLESELQQLLSEEGEGGGAGGGGVGGGSVGGGGGGGGVVTTVGAVTTAGTTTTAATASTSASSGGDVAAPAGVSVTPYADYADAGWGPNGTGYKYHYQVLPATGTTPVIDVQNSTANHVRLSPLKPSTTYRFRVSSQTPRGMWTAYHTFKTKAK
jgi:hypothetical protein